MNRGISIATTMVVAATLASPAMAASGTAAPATSQRSTGTAPASHDVSRSLAASAASALVAQRPPSLHASTEDAFRQLPVLAGTHGLLYVPYERTHKGVPVVGGDFVIVTDTKGTVLSASAGQDTVLHLSTAAELPRSAAASIARAMGHGAAAVRSTRLVVLANVATPRLAWESIAVGTRGTIPSRLHVFVDALSGSVLHSYDEVSDGTGTGAINGPNPLSIATTGMDGEFVMSDPTRPGISCRNFADRAMLVGTDDRWGDGNGSTIETGCVDALYSVQRQWTMLASWLGRNGINGSGRGFPVDVGLTQNNAFWDGSRVTIGRNTQGRWISSLDVVGHEYGHAIDSTTPGGQSGHGVSEATADIFGALTEAHANQSAIFDPPDYLVGEEINLLGDGPIRNMANPAALSHPNCYSESILRLGSHAAAGPFNHWFYLVAQGSKPINGNPLSPTCNALTVSGALGNLNAGRIFYNAMLSKTTGMTYPKYRVATLNAAKNMFRTSCAPFNTVRAAWNAVSVPPQPGEPTCQTVPNVLRMDQADAVSAIRAAGLVPVLTGVTGVDSIVFAQTPGPSAVVNLGATVVVTMKRIP
jgi:zinc metalloprotease ZmpA